MHWQTVGSGTDCANSVSGNVLVNPELIFPAALQSNCALLQCSWSYPVPQAAPVKLNQQEVEGELSAGFWEGSYL